MAKANTTRVNVGCGSTPTEGWLNFDNSPTVRLARLPVIGTLLGSLPNGAGRAAFVRAVRECNIQWAKATSLPCASQSLEVVYSSHMIEHLVRTDAAAFLEEAMRVLCPGGTLRLVVPDLRKLAEQYVVTGDADSFVQRTLLAPTSMAGLWGRLRLAAFGSREHAWMYDGASLSRVVQQAGFIDTGVVEPGTTRIASPGPLDLAERAAESVYVEATRP